MDRPKSPTPPPPSHRFASAAAATLLLRRLSTHEECACAVADGADGTGPHDLQAAVQAAVNARRNAVAALLDRVMRGGGGAEDGPPSSPRALPSPILMPHVIRDALAEEDGGSGSGDGLDELLSMLTEAVVRPPTLALALRPGVGLSAFLALDAASLRVSRITVSDYLAVKESLAGTRLSLTEQVLGSVEIDMAPFWPTGLPGCRTDTIGRGVSVINSTLCGRLFNGSGDGQASKSAAGRLFNGSGDGQASKGSAALHAFLTGMQRGGAQLGLLPAIIASPADLAPAVEKAVAALEGVPGETPWAEVAPRLADLGFAPGWGATAGRAAETLGLLARVLPDGAPASTTTTANHHARPADLENLLARLPSAGGHSIVMVSPHGFFAQANALGKPDTGGQVVYVLDAVRALEKELSVRAADAGIAHLSQPRIVILTRLIPDAPDGTNCNVRREAVEGTSHAIILRVPFRNGGGVVQGFVSRFAAWPYLEQFAVDAMAELRAELGGEAPALICGHYTDGGLVAGHLKERAYPTAVLCHVAHALEKVKYPQSALLWASSSLAGYNMGCHLTADVLNINRADFIITSTFQEIAGAAKPNPSAAMGQYESMAAFVMPGLFRLTGGANVFDPRFNICSPGADAEIYFSYAAADRRLTGLHPGLRELMYGEPGPDAKGSLTEGSPVLFSMARLDKVKNLAGLAAWYAASPRLQAVCALFIVGGDPGAAPEALDVEAASEAAALHELFDSGRLPPGKARWVKQQQNPVRNGELYRLVADTRGAFVLPSLFENFGLTVVEAASSGLPVFVSQNGGCSEIIHDGAGGRHIDPYHGEESADRMAAFFEAAAADGGKTWDDASAAALARVEARYNWATYARSLVTMSRTYAFWSAASKLDQAAAARRSYLQLIYQLILRPLMSRVPLPPPTAGGGGGGGEGGGEQAADSSACRGVCAIALGALADPGAVAPAAGGSVGRASASPPGSAKEADGGEK